LIAELVEQGADVFAYDPVANNEAKNSFISDLGSIRSQAVKVSDSMTDILDQADALVIMTEWKVFKSPDFLEIKKRLKSPNIFDGRNLYDPVVMRELGFSYYPIGRNSVGLI
jgi:UDPglucose 6-dehydrogenase